MSHTTLLALNYQGALVSSRDCLIKLVFCPNWPFWCSSFDVLGWDGGVKTRKHIKETEVLLSQLFSPRSRWKHSAEHTPGDSHVLTQKGIVIIFTEFLLTPNWKLKLHSKTSNNAVNTEPRTRTKRDERIWERRRKQKNQEKKRKGRLKKNQKKLYYWKNNAAWMLSTEWLC